MKSFLSLWKFYWSVVDLQSCVRKAFLELRPVRDCLKGKNSRPVRDCLKGKNSRPVRDCLKGKNSGCNVTGVGEPASVGRGCHIFRDPEHLRRSTQASDMGRTGLLGMRAVQSLGALGSGWLMLGSMLSCHHLEILYKEPCICILQRTPQSV